MDVIITSVGDLVRCVSAIQPLYLPRNLCEQIIFALAVWKSLINECTGHQEASLGVNAGWCLTFVFMLWSNVIGENYYQNRAA